MKIMNKLNNESKYSIEDVCVGDIVALTYGLEECDMELWYAIVAQSNSGFDYDFYYVDLENGETFEDVDQYRIFEIYRNSEITLKK